jgi:hypothetical protein
LPPTVDAYDRTMHCHFVLTARDDAVRFDQSGRLFGGFWLNLKSSRGGSTRNEGKRHATLDLCSALFERLAQAVEHLGREFRH